MKNKEYSLREIKHGKTKIAIMNAFIKLLEKARYENISIKQLCKSVEVSEGTFFNYFPEKIDIINYYVRLIFMKVIWKAKKDAPKGKYLALLNAVFARMAEEMSNANIMYQLISVMVNQQERPKGISISKIERKIVFPGYAGIDDIPSASPDDLFREYLKGAVSNGELPKNTQINDAVVYLTAIMVGTLLAGKFEHLENKGYHYKRQLDFLWKGLGARGKFY